MMLAAYILLIPAWAYQIDFVMFATRMIIMFKPR